MTEINGVPSTAPLFRGASEEALLSIVESLSSASHHYADDSGKEWGVGRAAVKSAARHVNALGLGFNAAHRLHKHTSQLVSFDEFINAVLSDARAEK